MGNFTTLQPGGRPLVRFYLAFMLWFVGRAIQAAALVDPNVRKEFNDLPDDFSFSLGAAFNGPQMAIGKDSNGKVKYLGKNSNIVPQVKITIKSMEALFLLFTFRESTPIANSRERMIVEGNLSHACACVRILDIVQVYLLPKPIAKLAIKRYPKWSLKKHTINRLLVNLRAIIGF